MPYQSTVYGDMTAAMIRSWQNVFRQALQRALQEFQPDVVFCHHLWFLTDLVCCQAPASIPVYAFCHGTDLRQAHQHPDLCQRYVTHLNRLQGIFALSQQQAQTIQDTYHLPASKINVIGGGYDPNVFHPLPRTNHDSEVRIVYAGKLFAAKGLFALMHVFARLSDQDDQLTLNLIGNAKPDIKDQLRPYLANPHLHLHPAVSQEQLVQIYAQNDIFVLPSYFEGMPLSVVEALACHLRVVVTDIPALQEQLGPRVNNSGVISYVQRPRLVNQDQPVAADLPQFYDRLKAAFEQQIQRVRAHQGFSPALDQAIQQNSWPHLIKKITAAL